MARKGIREYRAKHILGRIIDGYGSELALIGPGDDPKALEAKHPWTKNRKLVVKPDQLFGKRGKHGLVGVGLSATEVVKWIEDRRDKPVTVSGITDTLTHFLVEPFTPHEREYYVAISSHDTGDSIHLCADGGICIEENWEKVATLRVAQGERLDEGMLLSRCTEMFGDGDSKVVAKFVADLYQLFVDGHFTYFEINPFTLVSGRVAPLDAVVRVDDTASFEAEKIWGKFEMPVPFGRTRSKEEAFIEELDAKTGASLKLSVLRPQGRIWTMVAGGGASVIYADTIADLGWGAQLANYGEYSGDPSAELTYHYAKTIIDLMTREKAAGGKPKFLFIGGGIANFTDVASTFTGIIRAIEEMAEPLRTTDVRIFVRRGGPNYKVGLERMRALGEKLGLPIAVYGPETHMTNIVSLALKEDRP
ncbi:MAG: ATPase [Myxococcota bacterium]|jgi:ATP-citrate lyase beta-subunit|nr:ATPase [Myxococcota bacterium]